MPKSTKSRPPPTDIGIIKTNPTATSVRPQAAVVLTPDMTHAQRAVHAGLGFNWLTGLGQLRIRYYQGIAAQRPFSYFVYANLAAWLGNRHNHHPDVAFGWGYCQVSFTTHDAGGLTDADFACAAHLDALLS